jgi:hypothetical protein
LYVNQFLNDLNEANKLAATKCSHFLTIDDCLPGLRLGLRLMDLKNGVHRSSAGQLNLSRRLQINLDASICL